MTEFHERLRADEGQAVLIEGMVRAAAPTCPNRANHNDSGRPGTIDHEVADITLRFYPCPDCRLRISNQLKAIGA